MRSPWREILDKFERDFQDRETEWKVDPNGHFFEGSEFRIDWVTRGFTAVCSEDDLELLTIAMELDETLPQPVRVGRGDAGQCSGCGKNPRFRFDGKTVSFEDGCRYPDRNVSWFSHLSVPSGRVVVDDDLRRFFNYPSLGHNVSSLKGKIGYIEHYAKQGLAVGYVSNTCPSLFRSAPGILWIANDDEDHPDYGLHGEEVASICTDWWWYSIADAELLRSKGADLSEFEAEGKVVDVKPGTYQVRWFGDPQRRGHTILRAQLDWVPPTSP